VDPAGPERELDRIVLGVAGFQVRSGHQLHEPLGAGRPVDGEPGRSRVGVAPARAVRQGSRVDVSLRPDEGHQIVDVVLVEVREEDVLQVVHPDRGLVQPLVDAGAAVHQNGHVLDQRPALDALGRVKLSSSQ